MPFPQVRSRIIKYDEQSATLLIQCHWPHRLLMANCKGLTLQNYHVDIKASLTLCLVLYLYINMLRHTIFSYTTCGGALTCKRYHSLLSRVYNGEESIKSKMVM